MVSTVAVVGLDAAAVVSFAWLAVPFLEAFPGSEVVGNKAFRI